MILLETVASSVAQQTTVNLITAVLMTAGTGIASSFATWFFSRRKNDAQADGSEISNMGQIIETWRGALNDMEKDFEKKKGELEAVEKEFDTFKKKFDEMSIEIAKLRVELAQKEGEIERLLRKNKELRKIQGNENTD